MPVLEARTPGVARELRKCLVVVWFLGKEMRGGFPGWCVVWPGGGERHKDFFVISSYIYLVRTIYVGNFSVGKDSQKHPEPPVPPDPGSGNCSACSPITC